MLIAATITIQAFAWSHCVDDPIHNKINKRQFILVEPDATRPFVQLQFVWVKSLCSSSVSVKNASHSTHHWMGIRELPLM